MRRGYKAVGVEWEGRWVGRGRNEEVKRRMTMNTPKKTPTLSISHHQIVTDCEYVRIAHIQMYVCMHVKTCVYTYVCMLCMSHIHVYLVQCLEPLTGATQ